MAATGARALQRGAGQGHEHRVTTTHRKLFMGTTRHTDGHQATYSRDQSVTASGESEADAMEQAHCSLLAPAARAKQLRGALSVTGPSARKCPRQESTLLSRNHPCPSTGTHAGWASGAPLRRAGPGPGTILSPTSGLAATRLTSIDCLKLELQSREPASLCPREVSAHGQGQVWTGPYGVLPLSA